MSHISVPPELPKLQRAVMECVWELGEVTVASTLDALNARADKRRAYSTVLTTLRRLYLKGLLDRRRERRSDVFAPSVSRDDYLRARAAADFEALVSRYGDVVLVRFARIMADLDPTRRERIRRLADG